MARCSGSQDRVCGVSGSRPAIDAAAVSTRPARGRYCPRTRELAPSAPMRTSPVAVLPSVKCAVIRPLSPTV
ncbi:MAG: hypothetical protein WAN20_10390 [Pseudonocardiaceae bacterium]